MVSYTNRYVWPADGGFHTEEQTASAATTHSYSGGTFFSGGGGAKVTSDVAIFGKAFSWSLARTTAYLYDGYASGAFDTILPG